MSLNKYYISVSQLFRDYCPSIITRKYKNVKNILLYADIWNGNNQIIGYIKFAFNVLNNKNIFETFMIIEIKQLNLLINTMPNIGLDQSIIDYISTLSTIEYYSSILDKNIIINIDSFIYDKDPLTFVSPSITYELICNI